MPGGAHMDPGGAHMDTQVAETAVFQKKTARFPVRLGSREKEVSFINENTVIWQ